MTHAPPIPRGEQRPDRPRIFGIGLNKTGTSSLHEALRTLGYESLHWGGPEVHHKVKAALDAGVPMLTHLDQRYDAFSDIGLLSRRFALADRQYPGSRFILTVRPVDEWIDSRRRHVENNIRRKAAGEYNGTFLEVDLDKWMIEWELHMERAHRYFRGRDDFIEIDITHDAHWGPICKLLGVPEPETPFPWKNYDKAVRAPVEGAKHRSATAAPEEMNAMRRKAKQASRETDLARLLAQHDGKPPAEVFGDVTDDLWLWLNTEGLRRSPELADVLPGLPDAEVQRQWTGRADDETLIDGFNIYRLVRSLYERNVGDVSGAEGVLDFGCGWGRIIRYFLRDVDHTRLHGSDANESLVEFCRASNRWCTFMRNDTVPPLPVEDDRFDLIYVYSVFSHFSEEMHWRWLEEFKRVLRPGGALAVSVRPRRFIEHCRNLREPGAEVRFPILPKMFLDADAELARYDAGEFCYSPYDTSRPGAWWGEACIPRTYIEREWSKLFDVREFVGAAAPIHQHFVLLRA
jgi:SAM-dependent methyltransferase